MDEKQKDEIREIVNISIQEFMSSISKGIGRGIIDKVFWAVMGALIYFTFGHFNK